MERTQVSLGILRDPLVNNLAVVFIGAVAEIAVKGVSEEKQSRCDKALETKVSY